MFADEVNSVKGGLSVELMVNVSLAYAVRSAGTLMIDEVTAPFKSLLESL